MTRSKPLNDEEERAWRALMRLTVTMPRALSEHLERGGGMSGTDYLLMMHLSEAPDRRLRMSDLAERMAFSAGRITRIVGEMVDAGRVRRVPCPDDARSTLAELTDKGLAAVVDSYPTLLDTVRRNVFDHVTKEETQSLGTILQRLADVVDADRAARPGRH